MTNAFKLHVLGPQIISNLKKGAIFIAPLSDFKLESIERVDENVKLHPAIWALIGTSCRFREITINAGSRFAHFKVLNSTFSARHGSRVNDEYLIG